MAFEGEYECTNCGKVEERELLAVKKVSFHEIGVGGGTLRSRTVAWLCPLCVARDEHWTRDEYNSPGMKGAARNKARTRKRKRESELYQRIINESAQTQEA